MGMKGSENTVAPATAGRARTTMSWSSRVALLALAVAALFVLPSIALANEGANLDQCGNGPALPGTSCPPGWQDGNINSSNSHYAEGDSVPFRLVLTGLTDGAHTVVIQYDAIDATKHAYDYLTSFGRSVP